MFGIGMPELIVIFVIALLVFGPAELPKLAKSLGRIMGEFKRTSDELMQQIQQEIDAAGEEPKPPAPAAEAPSEPSAPAAEWVSPPAPGDALPAAQDPAGSEDLPGPEGGGAAQAAPAEAAATAGGGGAPPPGEGAPEGGQKA